MENAEETTPAGEMILSNETLPESQLPRFGLSSFRPGQREVIASVLAGEDCLCIMPTGGGKSLCYQLPSVARDGVTLVISPLIALMKDQVDSLTARGIKATFINSSLDLNELRERLSDMAAGVYDLVYIAPERLRNKSFIDALANVKVQLLAVDEAHCVSEWGHDFRPDYARIGKFREQIGNPQTIALTATATPLVRSDVMEVLRLRTPQVFITGFARHNLHFEVREVWGKDAKWQAMQDLLENTPGCGIVYASTRKRCEEVTSLLRESGLHRPVRAYHAGLEPEIRRTVQEQFMSGEVPIIVATNAFGMGIDKADLRFVVHYDLPGSIEAYYQEAGRAGRDGADSRCLLLYNDRDRWIQDFFIESSYPSREVIGKVYEFLRKLNDDPIQLTLQEIKDQLNLDVTGEGVSASEKILEKANAIARLDTRQNMASVNLSSDLPTLVDLLPPEAKAQRKVLRALEKIVGDTRHEYVYFQPAKLEAISETEPAAIARALRELNRLECVDYIPPFRGRAVRVLNRDLPFNKLQIDFTELERRKAAEYQKLEHVISYAKARRCRQVEILDYFGDPAKEKCNGCDNCGGLYRKLGDAPKALSLALSGANPKSATPTTTAESNVANDPLTAKTLTVVRMALSGVARTEGRAGKGLVGKMLAGSAAKEVKKQNFDQLSTYGLLVTWQRDQVTELLDIMLKVGLIEQRATNQFRPLVFLSEMGRNVMKGSEAFDLLPRLPAELKERIRKMPLATKTSPPPAPVFEPVVIAEPKKNSVPPPHLETKLSTPGNSLRPTYYWTWKLHSDGYPLAEIAEIRRLSLDVIEAHLIEANANGLPAMSEEGTESLSRSTTNE